MNDQTITCRDCGNPFTFTAGEADFFASRGFDAPQRCASCRAERKANRDSGGGGGSWSSSGSTGGGGYSSGGGGYSTGSGGGGGGYSRGGGGGGGYGAPREMHDATCSACGQETKVPFAPTSGKPVYCRSCFESRRSEYVR